MELDGPALAEEVFRAYLHQILNVGLFHADPHPGNVFVTNDHKIALLDLGMVARIGPQMQDHLIKLPAGDQRGAIRTRGRSGRADGHARRIHSRPRLSASASAALVSEQYSFKLEPHSRGKGGGAGGPDLRGDRD